MYVTRISNNDVSIFEQIESQTTADDRVTLLKIQNVVRDQGSYNYLEIGSFRGGTIQPHYVDQSCASIVSIDPRPEYTPDERGLDCHYDLVKSADMLSNLKKAFPEVPHKVTCIDLESSQVSTSDLMCRPNLLFIDGEHTDNAAYLDFLFCCKVYASDSMILLHDSHYIFKAIPKMKNYLKTQSIKYQSYKLGGSIYCFIFGHYVEEIGPIIQKISICEEKYFKFYRRKLLKTKIRNKYPFIYNIYKNLTNFF